VHRRLSKQLIPSIVTLILRLAAAPVFYYIFLNNSYILAIAVFVLAAFTDIIDGMVARNLGATSDVGAYLDASVDFILILVVFLAFFQKSWYGLSLFALIIVPFMAFVITSGLKRPVYDPVGKYLGAFLMLMIFLTLLIPHPMIRKVVTLVLLVLCTISMISRIRYLSREVEMA